LNSFLLSIHSFTLIIQPAGNFFAALDDSGDEGAKPKPPQPKKETAKKSSAPPTQPAKKNDDGKRYVFDVLTKSCVAVLDVGACLGLRRECSSLSHLIISSHDNILFKLTSHHQISHTRNMFIGNNSATTLTMTATPRAGAVLVRPPAMVSARTTVALAPAAARRPRKAAAEPATGDPTRTTPSAPREPLLRARRPPTPPRARRSRKRGPRKPSRSRRRSLTTP